jgi:NitT/TauT family transport system permease protein
MASTVDQQRTGVAEAAEDSSKAARRRAGLRKSLRTNGIRAVIVVVLLVSWEYVGVHLNEKFWTSAPSLMWTELKQWQDSGQLLPSIQATVLETLGGFAMGSVLGALLGFVLGWLRSVGTLLEPFIIAAYSIPLITLAPLFVIFFGIGLFSKAAFAALLVFFMVFFTTFQGVRQVDRDLLSVAQVLGANRRQSMLKIVIPHSLVWVFSGLKMGLPFALIGAVVGEFMAATEGLGYLVKNASSDLDTSGVFAGIVVLVAISAAMSSVVRLIEHRYLAWQRTD